MNPHNELPQDTETSVSRRRFLGSMSTAAAASIIVLRPSDAIAQDDPKPYTYNVLGTDYVNVATFPISSDGDITDELDQAIALLKNADQPFSVPRGGQILIPRGRWTTRGGHTIYQGVSIEGVGSVAIPGDRLVPWGTELQLVESRKRHFAAFMFMVDATYMNSSLKNLSILLGSSPSSGLLITNESVVNETVRHTHVENVAFQGGAYGIECRVKLYDGQDSNVEAIPISVQRAYFHDCKTAFYCDSVNSGFVFDTCTFLIPPDGIALECPTIGNLSVSHCVFFPSGELDAGQTVLKTEGLFNNITFNDCQDESVTYCYRNTTNNFTWRPLVFNNCLIQSKFKYTADGSLILNSCQVYANRIEDSPTGFVNVYLKGKNNFYDLSTSPPVFYGAPIGTFVNPESRQVYEAQHYGLPEIVAPNASVPAYYAIEQSRAIINIGIGESSVFIYNNHVTPDSMVFTQFQSANSAGVQVRDVQCEPGAFQINLTAPTPVKLRVAYQIENMSLDDYSVQGPKPESKKLETLKPKQSNGARPAVKGRTK